MCLLRLGPWATANGGALCIPWLRVSRLRRQWALSTGRGKAGVWLQVLGRDCFFLPEGEGRPVPCPSFPETRFGCFLHVLIQRLQEVPATCGNLPLSWQGEPEVLSPAPRIPENSLCKTQGLLSLFSRKPRGPRSLRNALIASAS